jgi:hypothetical protein
MATVHYIAYGSNLHPQRLTARVPTARPVDVVELPGHKLAFHKRSVDGSAKCHVYTQQPSGCRAYGVLYEFHARHKRRLDMAEGNGYREARADYLLNDEGHVPYIYVARSTHIDPRLVPYHWYKELVLAGARYHGFPDDYIRSIEATPSMTDPDVNRSRTHEDLLREMGHI